jgi:hypothetical protein
MINIQARSDEMKATGEECHRAAWVAVPDRGLDAAAEETSPPPRPSRCRRGALVFLALLAGLLAFCHGCHADVDDELFSRDWWVSALGR